MNQKLIEKYLKGETSAFENDQILEWIEPVMRIENYLCNNAEFMMLIWHDNNTDSHQTSVHTKKQNEINYCQMDTNSCCYSINYCRNLVCETTIIKLIRCIIYTVN